MLQKLKTMMLGKNAYKDTAADPEERQQLALAALLVEMARADFDESAAEHGEIERLLAGHFELSADESKALLQRASTAMDDAVSLFDFTRALHASLDAAQKREVIRLLWTVALTDDRLDKYEDYLVRKVADLLYVEHRDVMRIKHEVSGLE
jgi:uncharacterized tellurite resistance protein B-like protein